ncbi:MAG: hypothetical protein ACOCWB_07780 [Bacteroidota bacterium]
MNNTKKTCLNCGELIVGRIDKKFCNKYCKNVYHNTHSPHSEKTIIATNRILRKNRNILKSLNPVGKTTVACSELKVCEFDFRFYTHTYTSKQGMQYFFCYEFGYCFVRDNKVLIINWQTYMNADINVSST